MDNCNKYYTLFLASALALLLATAIAEDFLMDTREGEDLTLKCRFSEQHVANEFTYYWARVSGTQYENVAIGQVPLNSNYRVDYHPDRGIYDLRIQNTSYNRDNGRFECRIKAVGTGADVHQEYYNITILTPPQPPMVAPGNIATATEDKKLDLTCSSIGGSPDPSITWYREGSSVPLQAPISRGGSKDRQTTSTLSVTPKREDDGAKYRCVVWNRAMPEGQRLETTVTLNVNFHEDLKQFFVKLLRKTRKSVQPDKLDSALAKFCYSYSAQDAWEVERFGYKKASLSVKLRILKEVLESQFDKNPNFRTIIGAQAANDLRSQPLGKDKLGNAYWCTLDEQCNLRIYQEHLDEEIWKVVATNREEMVKLIACLRGNELVMPSLVGIVDEDSSSNSMPPKVDALENGSVSNGNDDANGTETPAKKENVPNLKIKLNPDGGESTVEQVKPAEIVASDGAKQESAHADGNDDYDDDSNMSEIDELSLAASESSATTVGTKSNETQGSKRFSLMASKPPSNKLKLRIPASDAKAKINEKLKTQSWSSNKRSLEVDSETPATKNKRPSLLSSNKKSAANKSNKYLTSNKRGTTQDYDSDDSDENESGDEQESDYDDETDDQELESDEGDLSEISGDSEVGDEIEEPTMHVRGEGSGRANKCGNNIHLCDDGAADTNVIVSDAIEEDVFLVIGEGNGFDCDVGNTEKPSETASSSNAETKPTNTEPVGTKPMQFFFGQAGCLKLSPMKTTSSKADNENANESDAMQPSVEDNDGEKKENILQTDALSNDGNDTSSVTATDPSASNDEGVVNNDIEEQSEERCVSNADNLPSIDKVRR